MPLSSGCLQPQKVLAFLLSSCALVAYSISITDGNNLDLLRIIRTKQNIYMYRLTRNFDLIITIFCKTSCQCFVKFQLAKLVCLDF